MWRLIILSIVVSISAATALEPAAAGEKRSAHPNNNVDYDSPKKQQAHKKEGRTLDYDYGSVYCHQGCAGGFTGVLRGTARNPGMKR